MILERAHQRQQRVLPLVDDGRVERPQRRRQRRPALPHPDQQLRDGGPADREVDARQLAPQLEPEGESGLQLPGKAKREPDGADPRRPQARRQRAHDVAVERIALGGRVVGDLLGRGEGEGRSISREVELKRRMGRRDDAQPGVDRVDGARVLLAVEEADRVSQDGDRLVDPFGDGVRVAAHLPERVVLELRAVVEGGPLLEPRQALLDAVAKRRHRRTPQQRIVSLDVGIDGQHLDAVRSQEPGQRGNGEVRRCRITGRRIDEGDLHGDSGRSSIPGRCGAVHSARWTRRR